MRKRNVIMVIYVLIASAAIIIIAVVSWFYDMFSRKIIWERSVLKRK